MFQVAGDQNHPDLHPKPYTISGLFETYPAAAEGFTNFTALALNFALEMKKQNKALKLKVLLFFFFFWHFASGDTLKKNGSLF